MVRSLAYPQTPRKGMEAPSIPDEFGNQFNCLEEKKRPLIPFSCPSVVYIPGLEEGERRNGNNFACPCLRLPAHFLKLLSRAMIRSIDSSRYGADRSWSPPRLFASLFQVLPLVRLPLLVGADGGGIGNRQAAANYRQPILNRSLSKNFTLVRGYRWPTA